jgi:hypothetical protein
MFKIITKIKIIIQKFRKEQPFRWSLIKSGCFFSFVLFVIIAIVSQYDGNEFNKIAEREKQYFENSDYYIEGKIIQCKDYNGNFCAIRMIIDSISFYKTNNDIYIGYINKDKTEAVFDALFVNYIYNKNLNIKDVNIILDGKKDKIYFYQTNMLLEEHSIGVANKQWLEKFEKTIEKWNLNLENGWMKF